MRVLILTGQSDRSEIGLFEGLKREGLELEIMAEPSSPYRPLMEQAGLALSPLVCSSKLDLRAIQAVRGRLRFKPFDIIHAFTGRTLSNALLASYGLNIKRVAYRGTCGHISRWDPSSWLTYLHPGLDKIICVSEAVRQYLLSRGVAQARLTTIPKGHDPIWYQTKRRPALQEFGIEREALVIGCAANMRPVKGVDLLLEAASLLPPNRPVHLLLVGEVRDAKILRLAAQMPPHIQVHLPGFRSDAATLMGACHIFVMPSRDREGLPKAVIEAMAQAVPVVVTEVGGLPELVRNGIDGLSVPKEDRLALANALQTLLGDEELRRRLGRQAQERIRSDFCIAKTVNQVLTLYQGLKRS